MIYSLYAVSVDSPFHCNGSQPVTIGQGAREDHNEHGVATKVVNLTKDLGLNVRPYMETFTVIFP